ncbi:quercetin 2,3-dioxygenase [Dothidotthia symphoricarpi CBS 119687]|uniref:Quercetin 2,3-dioxygenase n=1 Tax=Dothidotthia symphoricarpi CBS 119687 TaxID=1392245 RepID=A0A6A6A4B8_9PLEO|nr:quercetin 2,3-dioxygenase [Dothidotthia symphoricarpi CBS 119687]KAF2126739.1 quercetin 2,3-dioxygenase [Dothidotthia symphoricarpi CBS 119687]
MLVLAISTLLGLAACRPSNPFVSKHGNTTDLIVTTVPTHVRPYIVRAYSIDGLQLGPQVYRFPVTGESSGGAFSIISTAAAQSVNLGVNPHAHLTHYENFYCLRGRAALWASKDDKTSARILTAGDYGAVPHNTTHTFQMLDPFVELTGVIQPGGFEKFFYWASQENYTSAFSAPFDSTMANATTPALSGDVADILISYDVHSTSDFTPPTNFVDGVVELGNSTPAVWHNGANTLAEDAQTPFMVAKGYGPKYLAGNSSTYMIVEPFVTSKQSDGNFTQGTITLSQLGQTSRPTTYTLPNHTALEIVDGLVNVSVDGFKGTFSLVIGDVLFVPGGTAFSFWGAAAYSKVMYVGVGTDTLDSRLIAGGKSWDSAMFPIS